MRLDDVLDIARGASPRPIKDYVTTSENGINWIKIGDTEKGGKYINSTTERITLEGMKKSRFVKKGSFFLSNSMSFGRPYILNIDGCIHDGWLVLNQRVHVFEQDYLYYLLSSKMVYYQFCNKVSGAVVNNLNSDKVRETMVPLPPLEEQHRIVAKIEEILPYIDQYDKAYTKLETFNKKFPEDMKKSILQLAMQGKLVEQRPEEGTADELYKQIVAEKARLIKDGKIPKERNLPDISEEEKKFELPSNWKYVRVQDVATYITDYVANGSFATLKKNTKTYKEKNYAIFVRTMDLTADFKTACSYIDKASYDFLEKSRLYGGELILPNIGGSIGKAFIMPNLGMPMSLAPNSIMIKFTDPIMNKFFAYLIQSPYGYKFLADTKGGTATPKFSKTELRNMVIMLPPFKEIERIVAKIEELLPYCDQLIK